VLKPVARLADAALNDASFVLKSCECQAELLLEMRQVPTAHVAKFDPFQVVPDALVRVQIRRSTGSVLQEKPVGDGGWTFAHDNGRKALEKELGSQVQTHFVQRVPEAADAERVCGCCDADPARPRATQARRGGITACAPP